MEELCGRFDISIQLVEVNMASNGGLGPEKIPVLKKSPGQVKKNYQFRHSDSESDTVSCILLFKSMLHLVNITYLTFFFDVI